MLAESANLRGRCHDEKVIALTHLQQIESEGDESFKFLLTPDTDARDDALFGGPLLCAGNTSDGLRQKQAWQKHAEGEDQ